MAVLLFWLLATLATCCFSLFVLTVAGVVDVEPEDISATETDAVTPTVPPPAPPPTTEPTPTPTRNASAAQQVTLVITASRGDCWVLARVGSETGRTLEEGVLPQGSSTTIRARRIWLSLGASGNVDVTVNGKPREIAGGTVAVTFEATPST